jgi:hypothetical protein
MRNFVCCSGTIDHDTIGFVVHFDEFGVVVIALLRLKARTAIICFALRVMNRRALGRI